MRMSVSGYLPGGVLMRVRRNTCPVDYRQCNQTVTVYRKVEENGASNFLRTVYKNAFLDFKKTVSVDKLGATEATSFLLVIPGSEQTVYPGDKVFLGTGPEIPSGDYWAKEFIPSKVNGLVVVKYADPKYWNGQIIHTEAGG